MNEIDTVRALLYPLGLVAEALFGFRFLLQWLQSERKGESVVSPLFWSLSLIANALMCVHAFIQLQYPLALIQVLNTIISWRNLNFFSDRPTTKKKTIRLMVYSLLLLSFAFLLQGALTGSMAWMRPPHMPWQKTNTPALSLFWHGIGLIGMVCFASRFWMQWWLAEKAQKSHIGRSFWWISIWGALLSLVYFSLLGDIVNIIGYSVGLLPYVRNLILTKVPPTEPKSGLFLLAGEASGDVLGSKLIEALRDQNPSLPLLGVGGPCMRHAGIEVVQPMEQLQTMGFSGLLYSLPRLYKNFHLIKKRILQEQPSGVVFIDYPDFNMMLAKSLRKNGYRGKLIHYVSPSVWAWRKGRVRTLAKYLDSLLSVLPFEKDWFATTSLPVTYVGHPLVAAIAEYQYDESYPLPTNKPILALFPGSRHQEIALNLPLQWEVAQRLSEHYTPVVSVAHPALKPEIEKWIGPSVTCVPQEKRYELMRAAHLALATSGTIVLENGLHALPTLVTYKLSRLNYLLGRYLFRIRLPFYTLVNLICEQAVFPEFIHRTLSIDSITQAVRELEERREAVVEACHQLRHRLLETNASQSAAAVIHTLL